MHTHMYALYAHMYALLHTCMHCYTHVCTVTHMYALLHTCMHTHMYALLHTRKHVHADKVCMYIYMYIQNTPNHSGFEYNILL